MYNAEETLMASDVVLRVSEINLSTLGTNWW